jgi:2-polyprenyl-3-methyl-5-hydroxy-6-metoxy-1,4-benzoquinol methylase
MQSYTEKTSCRVCSSKNLRQVLDLNDQPLANSYHNGVEQQSFPLVLNLCEDCFHLQLSVVVDPNLMFKDYLYVSGTSKTLHDYFVEFAKICEKTRPNGASILDIACNDGTQLDKFKERGWDTFGVDPAENLHSLSNKNHDVVCDYWSPGVAAKMNRVYDVLIAQNVFAHVDNVHEFLSACALVMNEESVLMIQTSQADMITNNEFDTIYHEHLSFFNTNSMKKCANLNGFSLTDVFKTDIHGTSYVFVLKKGEHSEERSIRQIAIEREVGLFELETYSKYAEKCHTIATDLQAAIAEFKNRNCKIVGYGAAAKGNTFLNFGSISLDYIVDDNPLKWNLLTPGRNIPIRDPKVLQDESVPDTVVVPLAWNFFKEISSKTRSIVESDEIKFIKYFPEVRVL